MGCDNEPAECDGNVGVSHVGLATDWTLHKLTPPSSGSRWYYVRVQPSTTSASVNISPFLAKMPQLMFLHMPSIVSVDFERS